MNNLYIKTNYQFLIHILLLFQIFLSKQSKINPILSNKPYKEMLRDELYKKYEELLEKQKLMEKNIYLFIKHLYLNKICHLFQW